MNVELGLTIYPSTNIFATLQAGNLVWRKYVYKVGVGVGEGYDMLCFFLGELDHRNPNQDAVSPRNHIITIRPQLIDTHG